MQFFNSGFFWFIEGILVTVVFLGFKTWMEDRGVPMPWWKWVLFGLWRLLQIGRMKKTKSLGEGSQ